MNTEAEIDDMTPGERYIIRVNTVSFGVESLQSLQVNQTIREYIRIYKGMKILFEGASGIFKKLPSSSSSSFRAEPRDECYLDLRLDECHLTVAQTRG